MRMIMVLLFSNNIEEPVLVSWVLLLSNWNFYQSCFHLNKKDPSVSVCTILDLAAPSMAQISNETIFQSFWMIFSTISWDNKWLQISHKWKVVLHSRDTKLGFKILTMHENGLTPSKGVKGTLIPTTSLQASYDSKIGSNILEKANAA